ncbi:hypothetical protein BV25DRAFT_1914757 [Artomyces pyxidatus]|uniref:Uncharacterized protein n=1 Tax=Artomyces pyxidatus TaxID=48021 RepID=A0ACB8T5S2_9AGAM|nr:hypothetical protein BV25DRAFT_1914757 [Artomyces pyxidatus]
MDWIAQHPYARVAHHQYTSPIPISFSESHLNGEKAASVSSPTSPVRPLPDIPGARKLRSEPSTRKPPKAAPTVPRDIVKREGIVTLVLTWQAGAGADAVPVYESGSVLSGLLSLAKTNCVSSISVTLEASVRIDELQGGGQSNAVLFSTSLYTWDRHHPQLQNPFVSSNAGPPSEINFRTIVPAKGANGEVLPPSFDARLSAIPGFRVGVHYEVVVCVVRSHMGELWRRRCRLRVPFVYTLRTRPLKPGPFPLRLKTTAPESPQTAFIDLIPTRREYVPPIETQLYLPHSQITPLGSSIPFRLTLSAPDAYLAPLLSHTPVLPSFHPLVAPSSEDSVPSIVGTFTSVPGPRAPVRVHLQRTIQVDARDTGVMVLGMGGARRAIVVTTVLAEGVLRRGERGSGCVRWWGEVRVPRGTVAGGGFVAERLAVRDELVVTVDGARLATHVVPFRQRVGLQLTSDGADAMAAVGISDTV